jgi:hypothetical protein
MPRALRGAEHAICRDDPDSGDDHDPARLLTPSLTLTMTPDTDAD